MSRFHRETSRRLRLRTRLEAQPAARADTAGDEDVNELVRSAVARLPDVDREAIRLVHWEGLHHDEVATILGLTTNAVELRLRRARARLRRDLAGLLQDDTGATALDPGLRRLPLEGIE